MIILHPPDPSQFTVLPLSVFGVSKCRQHNIGHRKCSVRLTGLGLHHDGLSVLKLKLLVHSQLRFCPGNIRCLERKSFTDAHTKHQESNKEWSVTMVGATHHNS
jgi:hypothetical protein